MKPYYQSGMKLDKSLITSYVAVLLVKRGHEMHYAPGLDGFFSSSEAVTKDILIRRAND